MDFISGRYREKWLNLRGKQGERPRGNLKSAKNDEWRVTKAASVAIYCRFFRLSHAQTVLDYGAGTLGNALYLLDQGFTVYAADLSEQVKVLRSHPALRRLAGLLEVG